MIDAPAFEELIRRVRAGDPGAAAELVRNYEPAIRRAVRFRLADARLGSLLESMDICQSVLASFFVRVATGQYELETPEQLLKLLTAMARNKLDLAGAQAACAAQGQPPRELGRRMRPATSSPPAGARVPRSRRATCSRRSIAGCRPRSVGSWS